MKRILVLAGATALAFTALAVPALRGGAFATSTINYVEEDWQLVVATTDQTGVGPQITTCMSPTSDPSQPFVAFDMNYREYPSFSPGGMQIQVWSGNSVTATSTQGSSQLANNNETITWTQCLGLASGQATYGVSNGQSTSFGKFGQGNGLLDVTLSTSATSLASYSPTYSVKNSGVSWESNLVTSMTLVQVRYYSNGVLVSTDSTGYPVTLGQ